MKWQHFSGHISLFFFISSSFIMSIAWVKGIPLETIGHWLLQMSSMNLPQGRPSASHFRQFCGHPVLCLPWHRLAMLWWTQLQTSRQALNMLPHYLLLTRRMRVSGIIGKDLPMLKHVPKVYCPQRLEWMTLRQETLEVMKKCHAKTCLGCLSSTLILPALTNLEFCRVCNYLQEDLTSRTQAAVVLEVITFNLDYYYLTLQPQASQVKESK